MSTVAPAGHPIWILHQNLAEGTLPQNSFFEARMRIELI